MADRAVRSLFLPMPLRTVESPYGKRVFYPLAGVANRLEMG